MGAIAAAVVGAGLLTGGASMGANSAGQTKRAVRRIAETPGLDLSATTAEAQALAPQTEELDRRRNRFNADELKRMLNDSIPNYEKGQNLRSQNAISDLSGVLPDDVAAAINRSSVSRARAGGFYGGGAGNNLVARDLGLSSLDLRGRGASEWANILGTTPMAPLANDYWSPEEVAQIRANERAMRIHDSLAAEGLPSKSQVWGKAMQQVGGSLLSSGLSGMGGGGGGGGGSLGMTSMQNNSDMAMAGGGV